ncbi:hypothetical protein D7X33_11860 [Butyricicoccus sp. 1XD8-22]|nr:hypothetical protein D7X33_11860 [Butyricicoccus sp. 1XD8-22]
MKNHSYNERLQEMRAKKDILIASHRGSIGVTVIDNTLDSFNLALEQHADILEMDIAMSVDGELFVIHDGMESRLFHITENVQHLRAEKIRSLEYYTLNHNLSGVFPNTFDEVLEHFKGKCMLNLDRCWIHPDEKQKWQAVFDAVSRHEMEDQVIFKTVAEPRYAKMFAEIEKPYLYMPMVNCLEELTPFLRDDINMVAAEVKFRTGKEPLASPEALRGIQDKGMYIWGNALTLGGNDILAAGHDDRTALRGDPDYGWGYFVKQGYDIVQSDFLSSIVPYYQSKGYRV